MSQTQRDYYDGATEIQSDPIGLLDRDNRNHHKKYRIITKRCAAEPGEGILEVGCGHGIHAEEYAKEYDYTGIDVSQTLVEETRRRVNKVADDYTVETGDAMNLDYADGTFDSVVGTAILHHMHDYRHAIREWVRVTQPGGSVTLMEPNYLFPKETLSTHISPEETHKRNMALWRLTSILDDVNEIEYILEPKLYTPPWPEGLENVFDTIDNSMQRVPGLRWFSQMILLQIKVL